MPAPSHLCQRAYTRPMTAPADQRFPIGPLQPLPDAERRPETLGAFADAMTGAVEEWRALLAGRSPADLARTYRPGAWTVQQLAHHVADAHLHGLNRLRHGLTEDGFQIQPFGQTEWLRLPDAELPVSDALDLLGAVNRRWTSLLRGLPPERFAREVVHPAEGRQDLWQLAHKHDWHLRHHLAHARLALGDGGLQAG